MQNKLKVFKENHSFTKEEIQQQFDDFVKWNFYETHSEIEETYKHNMLKLFDKFKKTLDNTQLPKITDDWWFYDFHIDNDGVKLTLNFCDEFKIESEIDRTWSMNSIEDLTLLDVKCDYLDVKEFAKVHNVTDTTVRQWIRRGKVRTAKKVGRDWLIPSITKKPKRGFTNVTYRWRYLPEGIKDRFPYLIDHNALYIFQNEEDKSLYDIILGFPGELNRAKITLSTAERESLELALIGGSFIDDVEELL
ncbi:helix-turn-helix domain-containing protein [Amphibacillus sp. MSJ-3]|uniref:helix-turn-helix domain-containing protein n=1 Tax=Amphibacillus sp. MSJ-3 TaxID=2841505 RepID=UPI001C0EA574|nr:helix-turn-helix domain-containing protein [Amphibacillus sp. MSJ-3]MBU5594573.1 helix-turn-helix domain-containing protein [Amphibacillus sp. MSJ-3]